MATELGIDHDSLRARSVNLASTVLDGGKITERGARTLARAVTEMDAEIKRMDAAINSVKDGRARALVV